ncbi:hypothetical protein DICVIV_06724 [Dictyocaulus viviparus]|uniref:Uncharacterized protein n=1 Tax=Dictyocaulus viviparus TaxID=29172 RepID=A0A0D8XTS1_DICVI|nr:hypothetical protein DICVIV_06724 [Dictyocaulus viviparus]
MNERISFSEYKFTLQAIIVVFLSCWCVKQRKLQEQRQYNYQPDMGNTNKARVSSIGSLNDAPNLTQRFPARNTPATLEPARLSPLSSATEMRRPQSQNFFGLNTTARRITV